MKKYILPIIAMVMAMLALAFALYAGTVAGGLQAQIRELTQSNQALSAQVEAMSARMDSFFVESAVQGVADWSLTPTAWSDGNGADVALSMTPTEHRDDTTVRFVVQMEDHPMADVICDWNGTAYTATVGLPAMNGYSYFCIFEGPTGTDTQVLTSPTVPTVWPAVYMEDALNAYCDLWLDDWAVSEDTLTITGALVQIQLPQLQSTDAREIQPETSLILMRGDEVLHRTGVETVPGEGTGSYEAELKELSFPLPALSESDDLELWLEVTCGQDTMTLCAAEWYTDNGQLMLAAG